MKVIFFFKLFRFFTLLFLFLSVFYIILRVHFHVSYHLGIRPSKCYKYLYIFYFALGFLRSLFRFPTLIRSKFVECIAISRSRWVQKFLIFLRMQDWNLKWRFLKKYILNCNNNGKREKLKLAIVSYNIFINFFTFYLIDKLILSQNSISMIKNKFMLHVIKKNRLI